MVHGKVGDSRVGVPGQGRCRIGWVVQDREMVQGRMDDPEKGGKSRVSWGSRVGWEVWGSSRPGLGGWSMAGWVSGINPKVVVSFRYTNAARVKPTWISESVCILGCISPLFDLIFLPFLRILYEGDTI